MNRERIKKIRKEKTMKLTKEKVMNFVNAYKNIYGIPKEYKWIAIENDGSMDLYENKPVPNEDEEYWEPNGGDTDCLCSECPTIDVSNWTELCFEL